MPMDDDRARWNHRHAGAGVGDPSPFLLEVADMLPEEGRALDVAGGTGRHALWLAERGLDATLVDVSDVGLETARREAGRRGVTLTTLRLDLRADRVPVGPWDVILVFHYLHRPLLPELTEMLVPGGLMVCEIATVRNLERHDRPPRRFLLSEGRLAALTGGLETVVWTEEWTEDRHLARYVGRR